MRRSRWTSATGTTGNPPLIPALTCFQPCININMVTISCIPLGPITRIQVQICTLLRALPRPSVRVEWSRSLFDQLLRASAGLSPTNPRITHTPPSHKYICDEAGRMSHAHGIFDLVAHTAPCETVLFP